MAVARPPSSSAAAGDTPSQGSSDRRPTSRLGDDARSILVTIGAYVVSRVMLIAVAHTATWYEPSLSVRLLGRSWDGAWYLFIAESGYPDHVDAEGPGNRWAFFPLLPLLTKVLHWSGLGLDSSGVVVSLVAGGTAVVAVHLLVREVYDDATGRAAALFLMFFPTAFVFGMIYTEGLFITVAALCLLGVARRNWWLAGAAASVGVVTRLTGLALVAVLVVEAGRAWRASPRGSWIRPLAAAAAGSATFGAYMAYQWAASGDPRAFMTAQEHWDKRWGWDTTPGGAIERIIAGAGSTSLLDWLSLLSVAWVVAAAVAGVQLHRRGRTVPTAWWVYSACCVAIAFSGGNAASVLRYTMVAFPLLAVLAAALPRGWRSPFASTSAMLQATLAMIVFLGFSFKANTPMVP